MKIQDYAKQQGVKVTVIQSTCTELFGDVPESLNADNIAKLNQYFKGDNPQSITGSEESLAFTPPSPLSAELLLFAAELKQQVNDSKKIIDQTAFTLEQKAYEAIAKYQKQRFSETKDRIKLAVEAKPDKNTVDEELYNSVAQFLDL